MAGDYRAESQEARRDIKEHLSGELADCDRVWEHAVGMFEDWTGRPIKSGADGIVAAILARSTNTFYCAVRSIRTGYGPQGAMLDRSLFEDMADAHWVVTDPDTAETRYRDHHTHGRMLLTDTIKNFRDMYPNIELPTFDAEERERLDKMFGDFGQKPWSGLNLHERVKLIAGHWASEADQKTLRFMHALAHRENNQTLHVSAQSLEAVMELDQSGRPAFRVGPRPEMVRRALFGAYWTFIQTVTLAIDYFEFPMTEDERTAMFSLDSFRQPSAADGPEL